MKEQGFGERVIGPRVTTNTDTCWATRRCGNAPDLTPLDLNLFSYWEHGMDMNCTISSILVPEDVGFDLKFKIGNITELKITAARTWAHYPTSKRIVEDILRFPAALAAVIEAKGAVVANVKRIGQQKRAKNYQKGAPEKWPEFVPHPNCAAAVAKRDAVWERWLSQQS